MRKRLLLWLIATSMILPLLASCGTGVDLCCFSFMQSEEQLVYEAIITDALQPAAADLSGMIPEAKPVERAPSWIVKFSPQTDDSVLEMLQNTYCAFPIADRIFRVETDDTDNLETAFGENILYICADEVRSVAALPNDPEVNSRTEYEQIHLFDAWEVAEASSDILVAVLDTGINRSHEDLQGVSILNGFDVVENHPGVYQDINGHGTAVTGLIAAAANNEVGTAGVAYGVQILPVRVATSDTLIYSSDFVSGLRFAADAGAKIINLSFGGYTYSAAEYDAVCYALEKGCILIASAGNDGETEHGAEYCYPASYDGVIAVGSCDENGQCSSFSQQNDAVRLLAPGEEILILALDEDGNSVYIRDSGSSYSAAMVTGVAALALSALDQPVRFENAELQSLLEKAASFRNDDGTFVLNALETVKNVNLPLVTGIKSNKTYNAKVVIRYNRGTAVLDGEDFSDGDTVYQNGRHILVVTDGDHSTTIPFRILYTPATYRIEKSENSLAVSFANGTATMDGLPYESNEPVYSAGYHFFALTDEIGNTTTERLYCDFSLPVVSGITDGEIYSAPVHISVIGEGSALLNDEPVEKDIVVCKSGDYLLKVQNGGREETYAFRMEPAYEQVVNGTAGNSIIADPANQWVAVFGNQMSETLVYWNDSDRTTQTIETGPVSACRAEGNTLFLLGEQDILSVDLETYSDENEEIKATPIPNGPCVFWNESVACIANGQLYLIDIQNGDILYREETSADDIYSNGQLLMLADERKKTFEIRSENGTVSVPCESARNNLLSEEWAFCDGVAFYLPDCAARFTYSGDAVACFDGMLYTTDSVYRLTDGILLGYLGFIITDTARTESGEIYVCTAEDGIQKYSSVLPYAPCGTAVTEPETTSEFDSVIRISDGNVKTVCASGAGQMYVALTEKRMLLVFRNGNLVETIALPFSPDGITVGPDNMVSVWNSATGLLWENGITENLSFPIKDVVYAMGTRYVLGTTLHIRTEDKWENIRERASAVCGFEDILCWVSNGWMNVQIGEEKVRIRCNAKKLLTDGEYILADQTVYQIAENTVQSIGELDEMPYSVCGGFALTDGGLIRLQDMTKFADRDFSGFECASLLPGGAVFCGKSSIIFSCFSATDSAESIFEAPYVSGCADSGLYTGEIRVNFMPGIGMLNGEIIPSEIAVGDAGEYRFDIIFPCGIIHTYSFSIIPALEGIAFFDRSYRLAIDESGVLRFSYLPEKSSRVPVVFSTDSDCIVLHEDGTFTAIREGAATVTVTTEDGLFSDTCKVYVTEALIRFVPDVEYYPDRQNGLILDAPNGLSAEDFLKSISTPGHLTLSGDIIGTGTVVQLSSDSGELLDSLTVVIRGDIDRDGYITLNDMLVLEDLLMQGEELPLDLQYAGDLDGNGRVTSKDVNLLRDWVLYKKGPARRMLPQQVSEGSTNIFMPRVTYIGDTIRVLLYLKDIPDFEGLSGRMTFDSEYLTYAGYETGEWECTVFCQESRGRISFIATGGKANALCPVLLLNFTIESKDAVPELLLQLRDCIVIGKDGAESLPRTTVTFEPQQRVYGELSITADGLNSFDVSQKEYTVYLPKAVPAFDYSVSVPENVRYTVSNSVFWQSDELDILFRFTGQDGETDVYTIHAIRSESAVKSSDATLSKLEIEGYEIHFSPNINEYLLHVPYDTERLHVTFETEEQSAKAECGSTLLTDDVTDIVISVTAEDGTIQKYIIHVVKEAKPEESSEIEEQPEEDGTIWIWVIVFLLATAASIPLVLIFAPKKKEKAGNEGSCDTDGNDGMGE